MARGNEAAGADTVFMEGRLHYAWRTVQEKKEPGISGQGEAGGAGVGLDLGGVEDHGQHSVVADGGDQLHGAACAPMAAGHGEEGMGDVGAGQAGSTRACPSGFKTEVCRHRCLVPVSRRKGGILSPELARQDPVALHARWVAAVGPGAPTLPQMRVWVGAARAAAGYCQPRERENLRVPLGPEARLVR